MNKPLILGVVTALALAGGEAHAAMPCANTLIGFIEHTPGGFTCTDGNLTFSDFSFPGLTIFSGTTVAFTPDSVMFAGSNLNPLTNTITANYRVTTIAGVIGGGTLDQTISAGGHMSTSTTMNGLTLDASGNESRSGTISPASTTVMVANRFTVSGTNPPPVIPTFSLTNAFSVPEPASLSLFGLGLAGLALARRRRGRSN